MLSGLSSIFIGAAGMVGFIYRVPERQVELYKDEEEELVSIIVRAYANEDPEEIVFITEPQEAQVS